MEKVSAEEFVLRQPTDAAGGRVILGGANRPGAYPEDIPYLADEVVMLSTRQSAMMALWWLQQEPMAALAELDRQSLAAGWAREGNALTPATDVVRQMYRKGELVRHITTGPGLVSLRQAHAEHTNRV